MKQRKSVIALLLVAIIGIVGLTFAYFANSTEVENIFTTKEYGTTYTEQFVSPDNWLPGDTTNKTITATNTGQVDQAVRISLSQEWVSHNGDTLALSKNGVTAAVLNLANTSDWTKVGDYYYYNYKLAPGETTTSFLESVTFNKDIELDDTCTESVNNGVRTISCNSSGDDYDNATYTLTFTIETVQFDKYKEAWNTSFDIKEEKGSSLTSFVATNGTIYDGNGANTFENDVYFLGDNDKNNVVFANKCWKIVRTTETGGVKILYNGVPTDGKCNNSGADTTIGTSAFNENYKSPAYVGYMYNAVYEWTSESPAAGSKFSSGVVYDGTTYTLKEPTTTTKDNDHHYTCNNATGTCEKVRYYYYGSYYIELDGTESIGSALKEMLSNEDINKTDSTIKSKIDSWYEENMIDYEDYLEDTVFCNDRSISSKGGWNPDGGSLSDYLNFKEYTVSSDLTCSNNIDKFTVSKSNGNGALKYPVGLLSSPEANLWGSARNNGSGYWLGSPSFFSNAYGGGAYERVVAIGYFRVNSVSDYYRGVRPAVSLAPGTTFTSGTGSTNDPFIVLTEG